jgi:hypothetical protein
MGAGEDEEVEVEAGYEWVLAAAAVVVVLLVVVVS